jgi:hypothetical protein
MLVPRDESNIDRERLVSVHRVAPADRAAAIVVIICVLFLTAPEAGLSEIYAQA